MGASIICRTLEFSPKNGDESGGMGAKKKKKKIQAYDVPATTVVTKCVC